MSGLIKRAEVGAAIGKVPSARPVEAPALPDPRIAALEDQIARLKRELSDQRDDAERAIIAARAAGREEVAADDARRIEILGEAVEAALATWNDRLGALDDLAGGLAATAIEKMFGEQVEASGMVTATLKHHIERLGREAILTIRVSRADFPDAHAVSALAAETACARAKILVEDDLAAGACHVGLRLGQADLTPSAQWAILARALNDLRTGS